MPSPVRPHRRHARRTSSQGRALPTTADLQAPTARRRNLCRIPASVSTRHAQVQHWNAELRDLTDNLAEIQQRIQQLETLEHPQQAGQGVSQASGHPTMRPHRVSPDVSKRSEDRDFQTRHLSLDVSEGSVHPALRPRRAGQRSPEGSTLAAARPRCLRRPISQDPVHATSPLRAPSTPYRLPELSFDCNADSFHLHLDDWLHASPPRAPTSGAVPLSPVPDVDERPSSIKAPASVGSRKSGRVRRTIHRRDESTNTVKSFDSYTTEAVHVYEASTAAVVRPCVRSITSSQTVTPPVPRQYAPIAQTVVAPAARGYAPRVVSRSHSPDAYKQNRPSAALVPLPLLAKQKHGVLRPDSEILQPRSSSLPLPTHTRKDSRHSSPSPWLARESSWMAAPKSRPVSETTVIRHPGIVSHSPAPSSTWQTEASSSEWETETRSSQWVTESFASDKTPDLTSSAPRTPRPSFSVTGTMNRPPTPLSFQPAQWERPSPPPTEAPRLDSSCTSVSDPPTPTSSPPNNLARLNLFPRIQQSSHESLGRRYHSDYDKDSFYTICAEQSNCVGWPSSPNPMSDVEAVNITHLPSLEMTAPEPSPSPLERPRRKEHRLREMISPGVKRQPRDMSSNHDLVRSPRKKLRTFLQRFAPNMNKARFSLPVGSRHSSMSLEKRFRTPPRLPTRQGSSLPFDEALLGELSRISDRGNTAAPSPARRIRNSMHDAAGLTFSRTAATHAHWRAQRSRSSILSSMHPRSRAPTGSTLYSSPTSGPSFHFLPKVDRLPVTPVRRKKPPMGRHRMSRY